MSSCRFPVTIVPLQNSVAKAVRAGARLEKGLDPSDSRRKVNDSIKKIAIAAARRAKRQEDMYWKNVPSDVRITEFYDIDAETGS